MGGFGSGRHAGTVTAEGTALYIVAASVLTKARLQMGQRGSGTSYFGEERFAVEIKIDTTDASDPFLELTHQTRDWREGDRVVCDRVRLVWTEPTYGGRRWWFLCPRTARRTTKLFLPNGGWHFWRCEPGAGPRQSRHRDLHWRPRLRQAWLRPPFGERLRGRRLMRRFHDVDVDYRKFLRHNQKPLGMNGNGRTRRR
jgi:hypothetical protein